MGGSTGAGPGGPTFGQLPQPANQPTISPTVAPPGMGNQLAMASALRNMPPPGAQPPVPSAPKPMDGGNLG
jgi:hypothetical protein